MWEKIIGHPVPAFTDVRGEITNLLSGLPLTHVALITSVKGSVRGNHYHPAEQYLYVLEGELVSYSVEVAHPGPPSLLTVHKGDMLFCPPGVAHAYYFPQDTVFLSFATALRSPDSYTQDTLPWPIAEAAHPGGP